jgi:hypothetical protein
MRSHHERIRAMVAMPHGGVGARTDRIMTPEENYPERVRSEGYHNKGDGVMG